MKSYTNKNNYSDKLKAFGVKPIQEYKKSTIKIKHICSCGELWEATPSQVLSVKNCRKCAKKDSHKDYLLKLHKKDTLVYPLEKYKGSKIKIKHQCVCGEAWEVTPNKVLLGRRCGCKHNENKSLKYKDRKTILYYVKINEYYKIGVTLYNEKYSSIEDNIKGRFSRNKKDNLKLEVIKGEFFEDGILAFQREQHILSKYDEFRYKGQDMNWFSGHTELFVKDIRAS